MIDLELTEDHKALIETVREFAQKEVAPYIKEWDEKQEFHREVFDKMSALNLLGVCLPEEFGGAGFDAKNWKRWTHSCASRCRCTRD